MSYMAACIANALLEQENRVLMTNFTTISNGVFASEMRETQNLDYKRIYDRVLGSLPKTQ